ncbi:hypothetical protein SLE2022_287070 [Rubroshorea leprosula]
MESFFKNAVFLFCFLLVVKVAELQAAKDECQTKKCNHHTIRFPFWLKGQQPEHCGYHGFELSCEDKQTVLELPWNYLSKLPSRSIIRSQSTVFSTVQGKQLRTLLNKSETAVYEEMLYYQTGDVHLSWSQPDCSKCEEVGSKCKLKNNNRTQDDTECYGTTKNQRVMREMLLVAGIILGFGLFVIILIGLYRVHLSYRSKKEGQLKIEKFLEDYKALKPSGYSYADIKRITDQFRDKLGEGAYGTVFKGRLSNDVLVAVKVLNNFKETGEEFINEVGSMCRIHHVNVTRLIGFCADGNKRALVYEYMPNESLEKFIFATRDQNRSLNWENLQDIAIGIAKELSTCTQISDFGLAKLCSKEQSAVSMTEARGTMGYIAPEVLSRNFGKVSYKSDVYSFGMLLLEMVGGRKNVDITVRNTSQVYFPEWVYNCLDRGEVLGIRIENERHDKIARKLTIVGLWCIQWYPTDRPSMKSVVQMLDGEADSLTVPPNPFGHADGALTSANIPRRPIHRELPVISELE